jgi:hypothetical protein
MHAEHEPEFARRTRGITRDGTPPPITSCLSSSSTEILVKRGPRTELFGFKVIESDKPEYEACCHANRRGYEMRNDRREPHLSEPERQREIARVRLRGTGDKAAT